MMATLVQELRNEEQFMADFAHGVVHVYEGWMIFYRWCFFAHLGSFVAYSFVHVCTTRVRVRTRICIEYTVLEYYYYYYLLIIN